MAFVRNLTGARTAVRMAQTYFPQCPFSLDAQSIAPYTAPIERQVPINSIATEEYKMLFEILESGYSNLQVEITETDDRRSHALKQTEPVHGGLFRSRPRSTIVS